jgi:predicted DNA-binding transcriptional regulator YafY
MTKTERWYAIVEQLRAASPRPRSAQWLADTFEVSRRTIERDLDGLLQAGVPLYAQQGRTGGWVLDRSATFAPPALDVMEVTALAVAVDRLAGSPFAGAGRAAMHKILGQLGDGQRRDADALAARVGVLRGGSGAVPLAIQRALTQRRVLRLEYADAAEAVTTRDVEPLGFLGGRSWYLIGWCRLRDGVRGFRLDRIRGVQMLAEAAPERDVDLTTVAPGYLVDVVNPAGNSDTTVSRKAVRVVPDSSARPEEQQ